MTVKLELANGNCEIFESDNYNISDVKKFHPMICKVDIFSNGRKIKTRKRFNIWFYKKFIFKSKSIQDELRRINEVENGNESENN